MSKVSVIIPTHNHAAYIREAVDSVLAQTYRDLEIIVIDDGSTDGTKEILKRYIQAGQIRYFYQKNQGLSAARNNGCLMSTGQYIKFLDSDDFLYPFQIEKQMEHIVRTDDPLMLSMTDCSLLSPSGKISTIAVRLAKKEEQLGAYIEQNQGAIHSFLFPKALLEQVGGFDESLRACEDLDLKVRLLIAGAYIQKIDYVGCCYRLLNKSMSDQPLCMFIEKCKVYEKINGCLLKSEIDWDDSLVGCVLRRNTLLIHEGIARRMEIEKFLPNTSRMTEALYHATKNGLVKFLFQSLGYVNYSVVRFHATSLIKRNYKDWILTQEIAWKPK